MNTQSLSQKPAKCSPPSAGSRSSKRHDTGVPYKGCIWEVDEFTGENAGLIIAEIELATEHQKLEKPPWLEKEVTEDPRYYNGHLVDNPQLNLL